MEDDEEELLPPLKSKLKSTSDVGETAEDVDEVCEWVLPLLVDFGCCDEVETGWADSVVCAAPPKKSTMLSSGGGCARGFDAGGDGEAEGFFAVEVGEASGMWKRSICAGACFAAAG